MISMEMFGSCSKLVKWYVLYESIRYLLLRDGWNIITISLFVLIVLEVVVEAYFREIMYVESVCSEYVSHTHITTVQVNVKQMMLLCHTGEWTLNQVLSLSPEQDCFTLGLNINEFDI